MDIIAGAGTIGSPAGMAGITAQAGDTGLTGTIPIIVQEITAKHIQGPKPCNRDRRVLKINIPLQLREVTGCHL